MNDFGEGVRRARSFLFKGSSIAGPAMEVHAGAFLQSILKFTISFLNFNKDSFHFFFLFICLHYYSALDTTIRWGQVQGTSPLCYLLARGLEKERTYPLWGRSKGSALHPPRRDLQRLACNLPPFQVSRGGSGGGHERPPGSKGQGRRPKGGRTGETPKGTSITEKEPFMPLWGRRWREEGVDLSYKLFNITYSYSPYPPRNEPFPFIFNTLGGVGMG